MHNIFCFFNEYSLFSFLFLYLIHKCCTHKSSFIIRGDIFKGILLNSKWNLIVSCGICAPKIISYSKLFLWFETFIPRGGLIIPLGYNFLLIFLSSGKKTASLLFSFYTSVQVKLWDYSWGLSPCKLPPFFQEFPKEEPDPCRVGAHESFLSALKGFGAEHWTPHKLEAELSQEDEFYHLAKSGIMEQFGL